MADPTDTLSKTDHYNTETVVQIDLSTLDVSPGFLEHYVPYYQDAARAFLGDKHVRPLNEYKILVKAAQTILPLPKNAALENKENFQNFAKIFLEAVLLFCMIDIMADDVAENADDVEKKEFMDAFFQITQMYFYTSIQSNDFNLNKRVFLSSVYPHAASLEDQDPRMQYIARTLTLIDAMLERIRQLPNYQNEAARNEICYQFNEMLQSCRFSRNFSDFLRQGNREEILQVAPTLEDFIHQTAGGMGTGLMVAIGSMLLKNEYTGMLLPLAKLIAIPGRIANDFVIKKEAINGQANAFLYLALAGDSREKIIALCNMTDTEEKEKAFEALLPDLINKRNIIRMLEAYKKSLETINNFPFPSDLNVPGSYIAGVEKFFTIEIQRCLKELQAYPENALIRDLVTPY